MCLPSCVRACVSACVSCVREACVVLDAAWACRAPDVCAKGGCAHTVTWYRASAWFVKWEGYCCCKPGAETAGWDDEPLEAVVQLLLLLVVGGGRSRIGMELRDERPENFPLNSWPDTVLKFIFFVCVY